MGACASSQITQRGGATVDWSTTAKVIHIDGRLEEFGPPIKATHVLSLNPDTFLCCSETMFVDQNVPHVPGDDELQPGQVYFVMPASKLQSPLSLQDLCTLAIKASAALQRHSTPSFFEDFPGKAHIAVGCCRIPIGFEAVGLNFPAARANLRSK